MDSQNGGFANRREYFRVHYAIDWPKRFLPRLYLGYKWFRLIDLCEKGVRFVATSSQFVEGETISALIKFPDSALFEIEGVMLKRSEYEVVLILTKGIPYKLIYKEQLRLRKLESVGVFAETP